MIRQNLELLLAAQEKSALIETLRRDLKALDRDVQAQQRFLAEKQRLAEQNRQQRLEAAKTADAAQIQISEAEQNNERLKVQLNVTKHQREYDAIRNKILSNTADISRWEDQALEALQRMDELDRQHERIAAEIADAERKLQQIKEQVAAQAADYRARIEKLEAERDALRSQVEPGIRDAYDRLVASRGTTALVEVKERICQGCYTRITKQTENLLMRDAELVYCPSCGRILMLPD